MADFKFLKDKPLDSEELDRFGYKDIGEVILETIKRSEPPFTIGLYGNWGTGKTTICQFIKKKLDNDKTIKVFYFDVWKYEKDSFRRQFLIELDEQLELDLDFKNILNQDLSIIDPTIGDVKIDRRILFSTLGAVVFVITLLSLFILILSFIYNPLNQTWIREISSISFSSLLSVFIMQFLINSIVRVQQVITRKKTDSSEGFEDRFKEILDKINRNRNCEKLIIIIDNLDRLEHKKAVDVLSDIKTFLVRDIEDGSKYNKLVFLIPCDNEAINKHLTSVYGENFNADEFLRKFFNLTFRIPRLLDIELDKYILEQLKETRIKEFEDPELAFVIMQAFRDNPREIKQFINSLIICYRLAKKRNLEVVLRNLPFLAKILVIRQKWPFEYPYIENRILRTGGNLEVSLKRLQEDNDKEYKDLEDFIINKTNEITSDIIDPFFALYQSEYEKKLPEAESFIISAEEKRVEDLKEIYTKIKEANKISILDSILKDYVAKTFLRGKEIISALINILNDPQEMLRFSYLLNIILLSKKKSEILVNVGFWNKNKKAIKFFLNRYILRTSKEIKSSVTELFIKLLSFKTSNDGSELEYDNIFEIFKILSSDEEVYNAFNDYYNDLLRIKSQFIKTFKIEPVSKNENNQILKEFIVFTENEKFINETIFEISIEKYVQFLSQRNNNELIFDQWLIYESIERLLSMFREKTLRSELTDKLVRLLDQEYKNTTEWSKRTILMKIIKYIINFLNQNYRDYLIKNIISDYLEQVPIENVKNAFKEKELKTLMEENTGVKDSILRRTTSGRLDVVKEFKLYDILNGNEKASILKYLISNGHLDSYLKFSEEINYSIHDDNLKSKFLQSSINRLPSLDTNYLKLFLINIYNWGILPDLTQAFYKALEQLISDDNKAKIVKDFFKNKKHKSLLSESQINALLS